MTNNSIISSESPGSAEIQRLLVSASQQPWGPGREIDAKVHLLHQELLEITCRLGQAEERPTDAERAIKIDHELRNKLTVYQFREEQRRLPSKPAAAIDR